MIDQPIRLEWRKASELQANPRNWRRHPKSQTLALAAVLKEVGWAGAALYNENTGRLIDGHLRQELAGDTEIPVLIGSWTEDQEALLLATFDPIAAMAEADKGALADLLRSIESEDEAVQQLLEDVARAERVPLAREGFTDPDEVPETMEETYVQRDDLWLLGEHRLLCGDSTSVEDVDRLVSGAVVAMMATDPPYAIYGSSTGVGSDVADDKMVRPFFKKILELASARVSLYGHIYICCDWRSWPAWWEVAKQVGLTPKNLIVWDKERSGLGTNYMNAYELVGFFESSPRKAKMFGKRKAEHRTISYPNIWRGKTVGAEREHNAQKPTALMGYFLDNSSDTGDIVLDPFLGSGTTVIAAEQKGRRCYAMEIEPRYVQVAIERWQNYTGQKAVKA